MLYLKHTINHSNIKLLFDNDNVIRINYKHYNTSELQVGST